jgi:LDH2 family malate/lactate/ureidoglycolate dehydrogenase
LQKAFLKKKMFDRQQKLLRRCWQPTCVAVDSHGIARLSGYVRLIEAGRVNPQAAPHIIHQTPSTATIDGDAGLGLTVAPFAMRTGY